jgi:hypothetical protein
MEALPFECRCKHIFPGILECPSCHRQFPVTIPTSSPTRTPHAALVLVFGKFPVIALLCPSLRMTIFQMVVALEEYLV